MSTYRAASARYDGLVLCRDRGNHRTGPTDSVSALIDEVRQKIFPILDNAGRVTPMAGGDRRAKPIKAKAISGACSPDETLMAETEATVTAAQQGGGTASLRSLRPAGAIGRRHLRT